MLLIGVLLVAAAAAEPVELDLEAGFLPDPYELEMDVAVNDPQMVPFEGSTLDIYMDAAEPHVILNYGGGGRLYIEFIATGDVSDPVLIVVTPREDALPLVNDDLFSLNPGVVVEEPEAGEYAIGIGSWIAGEISGTLYISETGFTTEAE